MSSLRLLPVNCTFSALRTTTLSPQSMCGVKEGLCLPRSRVAMIAASRPSTRPSASITTHFLWMSDGLAEKVFIVHSSAAGRYSCPVRESRSCKGLANGGQAPLLASAEPRVQHEGDRGENEAAMTAMPRVTENAPVLLEECDQGVLRLTLNRPEARNALSVTLMSALLDALGRAAKEPQARVVVIAGAGPAFCAGHDLRELRTDQRREAYERLFAQCSELMLAIVRLAKPVIAQVHGVATAAGCQLVATCDLAVAAEDARFATPGVNIGLFCSTPMVALTRAVGRKAAMEMLLTGKLVDSATAQAIGLVNRVVPRDGLRDAVDGLAREIAGKSALTVAIGKEAFYRQAELDLSSAYRYAAEVMTTNMLARDAGEGIDAFLAKRAPVWHDR